MHMYTAKKIELGNIYMMKIRNIVHYVHNAKDKT